MQTRIRNYLIAGVLVLLPVGVTVFILVSLFRFLDNLLGPLFALILGVRVPGLGLLAGVLVILGTGALASNVLGRRLVHLFDRVMMRVPFARTIYAATKQLSDSILQHNRTALKEAVLVEWPRAGLYSVGFVTGRTRGETQAKTREQVVNVFIVTTPNPTTGFLCLVPESQVVPLDMTVEDAIKLVVSAGIVTPDYRGPEIASQEQRSQFE